MSMNEIEARGKIKYRIANEMRKTGGNKEEYEDLEIAVQALKEIREYREIGTVEELKDLKEKSKTKNWISEYMGDGDFAWKCPTCDETFVLIDGTPQDNEYNFCPNCGQSLAEAKPCCANCRSFYIEYGMELCKHFEEPMEDVNNEKCSGYERY